MHKCHSADSPPPPLFVRYSPQIFSSLRAAKQVVQEQQLRPLLLLNSEAIEEFDGIDRTNPNAVVVGLAPQAFHYDRLNEAFRLLLQQPEAPLIAVHKGRYLKVRSTRGVTPAVPVTATVLPSYLQRCSQCNLPPVPQVLHGG